MHLWPLQRNKFIFKMNCEYVFFLLHVVFFLYPALQIFPALFPKCCGNKEGQRTVNMVNARLKIRAFLGINSHQSVPNIFDFFFPASPSQPRLSECISHWPMLYGQNGRRPYISYENCQI